MMLPRHGSFPQLNQQAAVDEQRMLSVVAAEQARRAERALHPSVVVRLAARVFSGRLDRALIEGADPASSPRLAARSAQLTSCSTRAQLADGLDRALASAQQPSRRWAALPRRAPVLANAALLRELASTLRDPAPLCAGGIARVHRLLTDGMSPMYTSREGFVLERELLEACTAIRS